MSKQPNLDKVRLGDFLLWAGGLGFDVRIVMVPLPPPPPSPKDKEEVESDEQTD